jgi:hypothetical protein
VDGGQHIQLRNFLNDAHVRIRAPLPTHNALGAWRQSITTSGCGCTTCVVYMQYNIICTVCVHYTMHYNMHCMYYILQHARAVHTCDRRGRYHAATRTYTWLQHNAVFTTVLREPWARRPHKTARSSLSICGTTPSHSLRAPPRMRMQRLTTDWRSPSRWKRRRARQRVPQQKISPGRPSCRDQRSRHCRVNGLYHKPNRAQQGWRSLRAITWRVHPRLLSAQPPLFVQLGPLEISMTVTIRWNTSLCTRAGSLQEAAVPGRLAARRPFLHHGRSGRAICSPHTMVPWIEPIQTPESLQGPRAPNAPMQLQRPMHHTGSFRTRTIPALSPSRRPL